ILTAVLIHTYIPFNTLSFSSSTDDHDLHSFPTRRSSDLLLGQPFGGDVEQVELPVQQRLLGGDDVLAAQRGIEKAGAYAQFVQRSEEHTSELQSRENLVCRLLLEKKKQIV